MLIPFSLYFIYRDQINLAVLHYKETGVLKELQNKWWKGNECSNEISGAAKGKELSLTNLMGVFGILIGGLILALFISFIQYCFKREKSTTTTSLTSNSMQMTDTLKSKSRLPPITSARDYDNGQVSE